jgi:C-terminal processing protease CtpA/Prc
MEPWNTDIPLMVLINSSSASSSEIVAGALQDLDRAVIAGNRSYGKGLVQSIRGLGYDASLKLTVGKYYTPNGVSLADEGGLQPGVLAEVDEETEMMIYAQVIPLDEDPQILAALKALKGE